MQYNLLQTDKSKYAGLDFESQWRPSGLASREPISSARQTSRSIAATFRKELLLHWGESVEGPTS